MGLKVFFGSDYHLGLKTDEIDRTGEIIKLMTDLVEKASAEQKKGKNKVVLVLGGDIFNTNYPSEALISEFITVLNCIRRNLINTFVMVGNHDAVPDPNRLSCLSFIKKLKEGYPMVTLVEDIKCLPMGKTESNEPVYFTFLPHISRALLQKKTDDGKYTGNLNTKEYIDLRSKKILKKVGKETTQHYVFSHLNVSGAHPGSEENLLRKSEVFLPQCFLRPPTGYHKPAILQAHIHSHDIQDNINIVGSPLYVSFGETGPKYSAELTISQTPSKKVDINFFETDCRPFWLVELDMIGYKKGFFEHPTVKELMYDLLEENPTKEGPVVKIDVTIDPESNTHDWKDIRRSLLEHKCYTKPIVPRVILQRRVRSVEQKIELPMSKKIQVYLNKNLKNTKQKKTIYKVSKKYWEAV